MKQVDGFVMASMWIKRKRLKLPLGSFPPRRDGNERNNSDDYATNLKSKIL